MATVVRHGVESASHLVGLWDACQLAMIREFCSGPRSAPILFAYIEGSLVKRSNPFGVLKGCVVALSFVAWAFSVAVSSQGPAKVNFARDVQPLLKQYCIGCHGPSQQMNGLRLDRRRDAMRGGTGTVIVPGNSGTSRFYLKLIGNQYGMQMPPTGALKQEQINTLKAWIDEGAEWPDDLAGAVPPAASRSRSYTADGCHSRW